MEKLNARLDCVDEDGKEQIIKYLDKCITKFFQSKVKEFKASLRQQGIPDECVERESIWRMAILGLITEEQARRYMVGSCK
jgi:hypothetical protein